MRITQDWMTSEQTRHSARRAPDGGADRWQVSWWPRRGESIGRNTAITAMTLAEIISTDEEFPANSDAGRKRETLILNFLAELGMRPIEALPAVAAPPQWPHPDDEPDELRDYQDGRAAGRAAELHGQVPDEQRISSKPYRLGMSDGRGEVVDERLIQAQTPQPLAEPEHMIRMATACMDRAYGLLGDAADWLRDLPASGVLSDEQKARRAKLREAISLAKQAINGGKQ